MRHLREDEELLQPVYEEGIWRLYKTQDYDTYRKFVNKDGFEVSNYSGWYVDPDADQERVKSYKDRFERGLGKGKRRSVYLIEELDKNGKRRQLIQLVFTSTLTCIDRAGSSGKSKLLKAPVGLLDSIKVDNMASVFYGESLNEVLNSLKPVIEHTTKTTTPLALMSLSTEDVRDITDWLGKRVDSNSFAINWVKENLLKEENGFQMRGSKIYGITANLKGVVEKNNGVLEIPEGVTFVRGLDSGAMRGVKAVIRKIVFPSTLKVLGGYCFNQINLEEGVELPEGLEVLGYDALYSCDIPSLYIPSTIKFIDSSALKNDKIGILKFAKDLETIPKESFSGVTVTKKIIWPRQCKVIEEEAFRYAELPTFMELPSNLKRIEAKAFCSTAFGGGTIELPDGLEYIGPSAFMGADLESIDLPDTVTYIGSEAFSAHYGKPILKSIKLPNNPDTEYGTNIFADCTSLEEVENNQFLLAQRPGALRPTKVKGIKTITKVLKDQSDYSGEVFDEETVEKFAPYCFDSNRNIVKVVFGKNLKAIGEYAFRDCENLKVLDFSKVEGPFVIQGSAFKNTGLEEIIIPSNALLERRVFENCEQLTKVTISEGITSLPTECFQECSSLTEVKLPTSLRNIRANAFNQCGSLTKIELPPRLTNLGIDVFNGCDLRYVKIPKRVACIPEDAFKRNENLSKVEVSVNLTKIGDEAFYGCKALTEFEVYDQASDPEYEIYLDVEWENDSFADCPVQEIFQAGQKNNFEVSFDDENEEY